MSKIHFQEFAGYLCEPTIGDPAGEADYEPYCGVRAEDPHITIDIDTVTCKRCLRTLGFEEPATEGGRQ